MTSRSSIRSAIAPPLTRRLEGRLGCVLVALDVLEEHNQVAGEGSQGVLQSPDDLAQVEQVCEEMQAYYDARSEVWQESERAETFAERQEHIDAVRSALGDVLL